MEVNHSERGHALLSASGAARWTSCPGSVNQEKDLPDVESVFAQEGTLAHEMCELKLKHYIDPKSFGKRKLNAALKELKNNELYQKEMDGYTDDYVDFIKEKALEFTSNPTIDIERRVDFSTWVPEGYGTCDCIIVGGNKLTIVDFKYGKGVQVDADNNEQLLLYALGAYELNKTFYSIDTIEMNVVQPRVNNYSTSTIPVIDLLLWGEHFRECAEKALSDNAELVPSNKACKFCKVKGFCVARAEKNIELAKVTELNPNEIPKDKIAYYLEIGEDIEKWVKDLKAYALSLCLKGDEVEGLKAVAGRTTRVWADSDLAYKTLVDKGIDEALIYEKVPLTLAKLEKALGKKEFNNLVGDLVAVKEGAPTLVKATDKREKITNKISASSIFTNLDS